MAKKKAPKVEATKAPKLAKPVRLDLMPAEHDRLQRIADHRGVSKAAVVRWLVFKGLPALEREIEGDDKP